MSLTVEALAKEMSGLVFGKKNRTVREVAEALLPFIERHIAAGQPKPVAPDFREEVGADGKPNGWLKFGPKPAGAVPLPEPEWLTLLRKELFLAAMKSNFTLTRDELQHLINLGDAREDAGRAVADEWRDVLLRNFPMLDGAGLDEVEHHCEWSLQQDRKRLHAMLAAPIPQQPAAEGAGGEAEPNGKLVGWWNGMKGEDASIRWGADRENECHDIPLYDGYNPIHYQTPTPAADAGGVTEDMLSRASAAIVCSGESVAWEIVHGYANLIPEAQQSMVREVLRTAITAALTPEVRHGE